MKTHNRRHIIWPHLICFLLANACHCSLTWGMTISGIIFSDVNEPYASGVPDVLISAEGSSATLETVTDPNGHWSFIDLPSDEYFLYFNKEGYEFYIYTESSQEPFGPVDSIAVYGDVTDIAIFAVSVPNDSLTGDGTRESPYLIQSTKDLLKVNNEPEAHYKLVADVDLNPNSPGGRVFDRAVIAPDLRDSLDQNMEYSGTPFAGTFDGNGFTIRNMTIIGHSYLGLFGSLAEGAQIKNVHIVDANIIGTGRKIGSLIGQNCGLVTNCSSTGDIYGSICVGGLVGINENLGMISCSFSSNAVIGEYAVGGLVGANFGIAINSYSKDTVDGLSDIGGLVGDNLGIVICCYSHGRVNGNYDVGGLVGSNSAYVFSSFWDVETSGQFISEGGIGLTTAQMQDINTYVNASWDFIDDTLYNTCGIWWIDEGQDYPHLWWERSEE